MSHIKNLIPNTVNPDLQKERTGAEFNVEEFSAWWHGGQDKLKTKREMGTYIKDKYYWRLISFCDMAPDLGFSNSFCKGNQGPNG